ncbi:hypothetical protein K7X08_002948 [Anisodus acutangulus]|uniref:Uncharacterized protein n=1 Tax=Anisodus acutangulus TaxID=402998 RepID=A0A9Q1RF92_9SOLA|nr:hypothetical protein K7X08_002948 [Anisodus acutangulus]
MTTCNKAHGNTSRPQETRLRLPDHVHSLPGDGEPLSSESTNSYGLGYYYTAATAPINREEHTMTTTIKSEKLESSQNNFKTQLQEAREMNKRLQIIIDQMGLTMKQEESPLRSYIPVPQGAENQQESGWASSSKSDSQYSYACDESVLRKTKSIEVVDKVFDKKFQRITRKNRLALTTDIVEGHFSNSEVNKLEREEPFSEVHGAEIASPYDYHDFDKVEAEISSLQQEVSPDSFRVGFIPSENTVIYAITVNYTSEPNVPSLLDSLGPICPNFDDGTPLENHVVDDEYEMLDQILLMYGINVTNLQWDDSEEDDLLGLEDDELSENNVGNMFDK